MMESRFIRDMKVSAIGMGCMGFSHGYGKVPEEGYAVEAIRKAHDFGCTFFDTAESYGREMFYPGHNEELVGKALLPFRREVILATKFHISTEEYQNTPSLYEIICSHLEQSMKRLQTNYIDLYYLHRINEQIPLDEIAQVMGRLIQDGKIRGWGLSQVSAETLQKAHEITSVTAVQNIYSMVERDCEKEIFPYCVKERIGVVPFSPIASGLLSGKITTETKFEGDDVRKFVPQLSRENLIANQPLIDMITAYAEKKDATPAQISLAWMLHKYPNVVPIPGSKNQKRILENLGAAYITLSSEEFAELENALDSCAVYGHRGHVESEQKTFSNNWRQVEN